MSAFRASASPTDFSFSQPTTTTARAILFGTPTTTANTAVPFVKARRTTTTSARTGFPFGISQTSSAPSNVAGIGTTTTTAPSFNSGGFGTTTTSSVFSIGQPSGSLGGGSLISSGLVQSSGRGFSELDDLSKNLKNFYANKDSCDVILQLRNKELKAHKAILMARSSVFAAMFQHDTLEKQTGVVDIPDCDPDSFPQFLEYLYCGCLEEVTFDSAYHLYHTSVKYDVQKLKECCIKYLKENLTADNVCDIIVLADKYDEMQLISETQKFFNENFSKIVLTSEWVNLLKNDYRLANKFLIELSEKIAFYKI